MQIVIEDLCLNVPLNIQIYLTIINTREIILDNIDCDLKISE